MRTSFILGGHGTETFRAQQLPATGTLVLTNFYRAAATGTYIARRDVCSFCVQMLAATWAHFFARCQRKEAIAADFPCTGGAATLVRDKVRVAFRAAHNWHPFAGDSANGMHSSDAPRTNRDRALAAITMIGAGSQTLTAAGAELRKESLAFEAELSASDELETAKRAGAIELLTAVWAALIVFINCFAAIRAQLLTALAAETVVKVDIFAAGRARSQVVHDWCRVKRRLVAREP